MRTLKELQADISEAEKMLADAQKEYREAAMQAFDEGRMEEVSFGEWRERHFDGGVKIYCNQCYTISPQTLWHERCPKCGARMKNAKIAYKKVEPPTADYNSFNTASSNDKPTESVTTLTAKPLSEPNKGEMKAEDVVGDSRKEAASGIIKAFRENKINYNGIATLTGIPVSSLYNWGCGQAAPREEAYKKLCKAYKENFGREYMVKV